MKQAVLLCGGRAERLRPYSFSFPKSCLEFLNLPLLSYSWFHLENLGVSRFLLNSHLFPELLKKTVSFLSKKEQSIDFFFEDQPLGSAGTLYRLSEHLKKDSYFGLINGDTLLFPSGDQQVLQFEKEFLNSNCSALFFAIPFSGEDLKKRSLYCDQNLNLKYVGFKEDIKDQTWSPFSFTGLALFKSHLLDELKEGDYDLFQDFINPILGKYKIKVFVDQKAVLLEVGDKASYLKSTGLCLESLFDNNSFSNIKKTLEDSFKRFDPKDTRVGLDNGKTLSSQWGQSILAPKSVRGLNFLKPKGFCVLGSNLELFDSTSVEDSVLGADLSFKGLVQKDLILNPWRF